MESPEKTSGSSIAKSASKVIAGGVLSLAGGLVNQMVIAATFGAGVGMDAFNTAIVVPIFLQWVLISGLSFVFVPAFVKEEENGKEEDAWALVGTFFWITAIALFVTSVAGSILARQIITISAPGFEPEKTDLAVKMLSISMFAVPFAGLGYLTVGIQNARNRFFWPSFGGAANSLGNVAVLLLLTPRIGPVALAWGFIASTVLQAVITIIPVIRHGWKRTLPLNDPRVREMGKLIAPLVLFGMFISFTPVAERYFASGLPDGQISYIGYAYKVSSIYVSLLASGIAAAIYPSMARAFNQDGIAGLVERSSYGLRLSFAVALPAVGITTALAVPVVAVLFQRGAFRPIDTLQVSQLIFAVLLSDVLFRMVGNIFTRTFYVLKNTLIPPIVGAAAAIIYILVGRFFVTQWGYQGLVWASALEAGLNVVILWVLMTRRLADKNIQSTLELVFEYALAACAAYMGCFYILMQLSFLHEVFQLAIGGSVGVAIYLGVLYFRDREMLQSILEIAGVYRFLDRFQRRMAQPDKEPINLK